MRGSQDLWLGHEKVVFGVPLVTLLFIEGAFGLLNETYLFLLVESRSKVSLHRSLDASVLVLFVRCDMGKLDSAFGLPCRIHSDYDSGVFRDVYSTAVADELGCLWPTFAPENLVGYLVRFFAIHPAKPFNGDGED